MPNEVNAADLPFYSIFVLEKVFFFRKFLITLLHVIQSLAPPNQKSWLGLCCLCFAACSKISKSEDVGCKAYRSNNVRRIVAYWHTL